MTAVWIGLAIVGVIVVGLLVGLFFICGEDMRERK